MSYESMTKEELIAALEKKSASAGKNIVIKVSPKGCVQINGIRKFPLSFYKNEWEILFGMIDEIKQFIADNNGALAEKG